VHRKSSLVISHYCNSLAKVFFLAIFLTKQDLHGKEHEQKLLPSFWTETTLRGLLFARVDSYFRCSLVMGAIPTSVACSSALSPPPACSSAPSAPDLSSSHCIPVARRKAGELGFFAAAGSGSFAVAFGYCRRRLPFAPRCHTMPFRFSDPFSNLHILCFFVYAVVRIRMGMEFFNAF
jgi:hypothetical protein